MNLNKISGQVSGDFKARFDRDAHVRFNCVSQSVSLKRGHFGKYGYSLSCRGQMRIRISLQ